MGLIGKLNAVHLSLTAAHKRYPCRWLDLGDPAAHEKFHLMLLPSGPDMVHGFPLRRTQTSTLRARGRPCMQTASERNSVLLERIAGYRTPLPSHLARHLLVYGLTGKKSIHKFETINKSSAHRKTGLALWQTRSISA